LEKLPSSTIQDLCHRGYGIEVADLDAFRKSLETIAPYSEEFALAEMDIPWIDWPPPVPSISAQQQPSDPVTVPASDPAENAGFAAGIRRGIQIGQRRAEAAAAIQPNPKKNKWDLCHRT
jgi:hypothetical protein